MSLGFNDNLIQGAVNEAGLMFDAFAMPYKPSKGAIKKRATGDNEAIDTIMKAFSTVREVRDYLATIGLSALTKTMLVAYAARGYYLKRDHCVSFEKNSVLDLNIVFSPSFSYNIGKGPGDCLTASLDVATALRNMYFLGICTWQHMPYDYFECTRQPDASAFTNASLYKINGLHRLKSTSQDYVKRILKAGDVIMAAVYVDQGFCSDIPHIIKSHIGSEKGGHAIVICGYDDSKACI